MVRATASEMAAVKSTGQQAGAVGSSPYRSSVIAPPLPASRVQVRTGWSPCSFGYANADNATSVACDRRHCTALTCMARSFLLQGDGVAERGPGGRANTSRGRPPGGGGSPPKKTPRRETRPPPQRGAEPVVCPPP